MNTPTTAEIAAEIAKLREVMSRVPRLTFFGDNNHEGIEAQIHALEESFDEDDCFDEWPDDENACNHARDAVAWAEGESDEPMSKGWQELAENQK